VSRALGVDLDARSSDRANARLQRASVGQRLWAVVGQKALEPEVADVRVSMRAFGSEIAARTFGFASGSQTTATRVSVQENSAGEIKFKRGAPWS